MLTNITPDPFAASVRAVFGEYASPMRIEDLRHRLAFTPMLNERLAHLAERHRAEAVAKLTARAPIAKATGAAS